jgi:hypothetical protein
MLGTNLLSFIQIPSFLFNLEYPSRRQEQEKSRGMQRIIFISLFLNKKGKALFL